MQHKTLTCEEINKRNHSGYTPLHIAAQQNPPDLERVKTLIKQGAKVKIKDFVGNNPLLWAVMQTPVSLPLVNLLLNANTKINAINHMNNTVLHVELMKKNPSTAVLKLLIERGALIDLKNITDETPLSLAKQKNREKELNEFLDRQSHSLENDLKRFTLGNYGACMGRESLPSFFKKTTISGITFCLFNGTAHRDPQEADIEKFITYTFS